MCFCNSLLGLSGPPQHAQARVRLDSYMVCDGMHEMPASLKYTLSCTDPNDFWRGALWYVAFLWGTSSNTVQVS